MSPDGPAPPEALRRLLAAARDGLALARDPRAAAGAWREALPGWAPDPARLAIYPDFVYHHVAHTLAVTYPESRAAAGPAWDDLVAAWYARRPSRAFDLNQLAGGFAEVVRARAAAGADLPPWLADLVAFEWAELVVFQAPVEVPPTAPRPTLNPTLQALEHPWRLVAHRTAPAPRPAPAAGDEVALLWRDPRTLRARFMAANARALLAVKLAAEGIAPADAARAGGVAAADVEAALREAIGHGFVLGPPSGADRP